MKNIVTKSYYNDLLLGDAPSYYNYQNQVWPPIFVKAKYLNSNRSKINYILIFTEILLKCGLSGFQPNHTRFSHVQ